MNWQTLITTASTVSGIFGFLATAAAYYFRYVDRSPHTQSVIEDIAGEYGVRSVDISGILEKLRAKDRLAALEMLLGVPRERAKDVLDRLQTARPSIRDRYRNMTAQLVIVGITAIMLSIIGFGVSLLAPITSYVSPSDTESHDPGSATPPVSEPPVREYDIADMPLARQVAPQDGNSGLLQPRHSAEGHELRISTFQVTHYRWVEERDEYSIDGIIGRDSHVAHLGDDVAVHVAFSAPAYCYLTSLDTNGRVLCRLPEMADEQPTRSDTINYPGGTDLYRLKANRGTGLQGFLLIASSSPLPSWSEFVEEHSEPKWPSNEILAERVMVFAGDQAYITNSSRDPEFRHDLVLIKEPLDWLQSLSHEFVVHLIAFPVVSDDVQAPPMD